MKKEALQQVLDIIEQNLLHVAGNIRVMAMLSPGTNPQLEQTQDKLGEALEATLKVKQELGLHSNLSLETKVE